MHALCQKKKSRIKKNSLGNQVALAFFHTKDTSYLHILNVLSLNNA